MEIDSNNIYKFYRSQEIFTTPPKDRGNEAFEKIDEYIDPSEEITDPYLGRILSNFFA
jgi:hypothetical protein